MRLFLAIDLSDGARSHLVDVRERLEPALPKVAYTKPANLHLTLKFLGEVEPKRVGPIVESLGMIRTQRLELHTSGIGCFPARGPMRVITAPMEGTVKPLRALVEAIEQRCRFLGFEREQRAYKPHVTLARARPVLSVSFRSVFNEATQGLWPGPVFVPAEFVLMESRLGAEGAIYKQVAGFGLGQE